MKCRSLLSAHIIHELLTGSRLQLACCTTLLVSSTVINSSTQSSEAEKNRWHPYADAEAGDGRISHVFLELFLEQFAIIDY